MRLNVNKSGSKGVLKLKGELTLLCAEDLKKALVRALKKVEHLVIDMQQVTEIDISCIQLFCSAHRTFIGKNRQLVIADTVSEGIKGSIVNSGFPNRARCLNEGESGCLWKGGF